LVWQAIALLEPELGSVEAEPEPEFRLVWQAIALLETGWVSVRAEAQMAILHRPRPYPSGEYEKGTAGGLLQMPFG
jgi:hypothetical protein